MTTFPGSPKLTKGAIVGIDKLNPLASVIIFQYNPKSLTRKLDAQSTGEEGARSEVLRLSGPPAETITISELEVDATDQLEQAQATAPGCRMKMMTRWTTGMSLCAHTISPRARF